MPAIPHIGGTWNAGRAKGKLAKKQRGRWE